MLTGRILVVDDNRDAADSQVVLLQALGYEAKATYDGHSAVALVDEFLPDMAFIDIGMPHLNGYDTVKLIRKLEPGKHIVMAAVTGWTGAEEKRQAYDAGFDIYVVKPMGLDALKETVALIKPLPEVTRGS